MFKVSLGKGGSALCDLLNCLLATAHREGHLVLARHLSATVPCVTLSSAGAQAGGMPTDGALNSAALRGALEEVRTLLEDGASIEEEDKVSDGTGTSVAAGALVWHVVLNMVQGCGGLNDAECVGLNKFLS